MDEKSSKTEVELIPTECLIDELHSRFVASVFVGIRPDRMGKTNNVIIRWAGGPHNCIGLLHDSLRNIHESIENGRAMDDE